MRHGVGAALDTWQERILLFPSQGGNCEGEGASGQVVPCWAWSASRICGHWELLLLRLLSPCAGCLRHGVLVSQSFLGVGGCCE